MHDVVFLLMHDVVDIESIIVAESCNGLLSLTEPSVLRLKEIGKGYAVLSLISVA